jgi:transcription termination factor 2
MSLKLYNHQKIGLDILKDMERNGKGGILADDMGMGKTVTIGVYLMKNKIGKKKDLIVCPLSLMKQWDNEIKRIYKCFGKNKPTILIYHGKTRKEKFKEKDWDYVITTYSIIGTRELNNYYWGRVILDESHYIKNGLNSNKPKCAVAAYKIGRRSDFNWCVTGTPFNNNIKDIASQCKFIGTKPYNNPKWWEKNDDSFIEWREKFVLRRTKDNILKEPKYHNIKIKPTQEEVKLVENLRSEANRKFNKWKVSKGLTKIRLQGKILGLIQRLRVVSNSYYCGEKRINADQVLEENTKVKTMIDTMDKKIYDDPSKSIIVFSQFTSYLDILENVIQKIMPGIEVMKFTGTMNNDERNEVIKYFTTSTHPRILLISLLAGGCGLNLLPCSTIFLSEPYYNPFMEKQAENRVHRLGQKSQVNIYRFYVSNSVETWINRIKQRKLFIANEMNLLSNNKDNLEDFSFEQLSELFTDLVGFKKSKDKNKDKINKSSKIVEIGIECSICLDDLGNKDSCNLHCGHLFHSDCLNKWKTINNLCPLCKRIINIF